MRGDGDDGLLGTASCFESVELGARRYESFLRTAAQAACASTGFRHGAPFRMGESSVLAGALSQLRTEPCPGDEVRGGRKLLHVRADLRD